jgi:gliding motility associated protien GldN
MKILYYISLSIALFSFIPESVAQDQPQRTRQRAGDTETPTVSNLTERAKIKNEQASKKPTHIVWERIIYRTIDLTAKENNAALYYPVMPQDDRQNLFTLIFKLMLDKKIFAYNYLDNVEIFNESQKVDFENFLNKYHILYTRQGERFIVDDRDIPNSDVTQYMIKEGYYFDQATGTFKTEVLAICPILVQEDFYYGGSVREILFWLKYEDIRPYLSREMIMTSNYNNALTYTIDDYFRKNMYTGDIVKTVNMMGKSLSQEIGNDSTALKQAQDSIEAQLKMFNKKLWVYNDSIARAVETTNDKKTSKKTKETKETQSPARGSKRSKEPKEKENKSSSQSENNSAPVKSVRRHR